MEVKDFTPEVEISEKQKYVSALKKFSDFYVLLLCITGVACAAAITVAIMFNVIIGIAIAVFACAIYIYFSENKSRAILGIDYKNVCGSITVTHAFATYGTALFIPSLLIFADVTRLGDGAFNSQKNCNIKEIYLPASIEYIGKDIFGSTCIPDTVYFEGTSEDWNKIQKHTSFEEIKIVFNTQMPSLPKKQSCNDGEADV